MKSNKKISTIRTGIRALLLLIFAASLPTIVHGQNTEISATVVRLQGRGVYLNVGKEVGILAKDTLAVSKGEIRGSLRVIGSSSKSALTTWVGRRIDLVVGDVIVVALPERNLASPDDDVITKKDERLSILVRKQPGNSTYGSKKGHPKFSGRLMLSMSALRSKTKWNTTTKNSNSRTFATPNLNFRGVVSDLPGGAVVSLSTRMAYRYSSDNIISSPTSIRLYQISLARSLPGTPLDFEVGRFSNANEPGTGYWDGIILRSRGRKYQYGASFGLEPDKFNEGFRADLPKYSAFVSINNRVGSLRSSTDISVTQLRPQNSWLTHTYVGASQKFRSRRFSVSGDVQVDRDPQGGSWVISRLKSRGSVNLTSALRVNARFSVRQPYSYWKTTNIISYRRDQASIGLSYGVNDSRVGVTLTTNTIDSAPSSSTYAMNFTIAHLPFINASFSGSGSYWSRNSTETIFGNASLSRALGAVRLQLLYNYYQTKLFTDTVTSHTVGASAQIPIRKDIHASLQTRTQFGQQLTSTSVFASLWVSL